jgi:predicted negative regulator of RcsB-dependent stress response
MATYDLEEQEQLAEIKAWWKQYGHWVAGLLTVAALAVSAWQGWSWYQRDQAAQASLIYNVLQRVVQETVQENASQQIKAASGELLEKFGTTSYAPLGALIAAKAMVDAGDVKTAKVQLAWVVEHAKNAQSELRDLARLRLAALLLDEKNYDEALQQLDGGVDDGFAARFAQSRGDIFYAQGKKSEARSAYQAALSKLEQTNGGDQSGASSSAQEKQVNALFREILRQQIDALAEGQ